jgi:hypothetical protein
VVRGSIAPLNLWRGVVGTGSILSYISKFFNFRKKSFWVNHFLHTSENLQKKVCEKVGEPMVFFYLCMMEKDAVWMTKYEADFDRLWYEGLEQRLWRYGTSPNFTIEQLQKLNRELLESIYNKIGKNEKK